MAARTGHAILSAPVTVHATAPAAAPAPAPYTAPAPIPATAPTFVAGLETDVEAGEAETGNGSGTVREAFRCACSDMTEKEKSWYSSHWAFDRKTISGEHILEKPPKKPGGSKCFLILVKMSLMLTVMTLASAQGFSEEGGMAVTRQPEIVFCLMISLFAYFLSRLRHSADRKEMLSRSKASRKRCSKDGEAKKNQHTAGVMTSLRNHASAQVRTESLSRSVVRGI